MIVLDEHFSKNQRNILQRWRASVHQIGCDLGRDGMDDDEIIPFLLQLRSPTFFTLDRGFYKPHLCHPRYVVVYLEVTHAESASFVRKVLSHKSLDSEAKRLGTVVRAFHVGLTLWRVGHQAEMLLKWPF